MALTAQQIAEVRYYMGYSVSGDAESFPYREQVYSNVSYFGLTIDYRLQHLSAAEEYRVTTFFLTNLAAREQEIQDAASNLDTDKAAVWTRNRTEVADRRALFAQLRRDLCDFLGFRPGPALRGGGALIRT